MKTRLSRTALLYSVVAIGMAATPSAFAATKIFDLSLSAASAGLGAGPFGTVKVTEVAGALDFVETLTGGFKFHSGNATHSAFAFDLTGDPAITVSSLSSGFAKATGTSFSEPPFGSFDYAFKCTGCGKGYAGGLSGPLSFKVTSVAGPLTLASLQANAISGAKVYFTTDVVNSAGNTGNVGAIAASSATPEPAAWALMIVGVGGVGAALRRRNAIVSAT